MKKPSEIIQSWRDEVGDFQLIPLVITSYKDIAFFYAGWYYRSRKTIMGFPTWIGPFELKEQAEAGREAEND